MQKWFIRLSIVAVAVMGAYIVLANAFLNTEMASRIINRKPEKLWIRWETAWTILPGVVHMRDLQLRGQDKKVQWYATLAEVTASIKLLALLRKRFHADSIDGRALDFRLRQRLVAADARQNLTPPIPGLSNPPQPPPENLYPATTSDRPWTLEMENIEITEIRRLWIDQYRFTGDGRVEGAMIHTIKGPIAVPGASLTLTSGDVQVGDRIAVDNVRLAMEVVIDAFRPRDEKGLKVLRFVSGSMAITGKVDELNFLEAYFHKAPWLNVNGHGLLRADLRLERGVLMPDTRIAVDAQEVTVSLFDYSAAGSSKVEGRVDLENQQAVAKLSLVLEDFEVKQLGRQEPIIYGRGLKIASKSADLDLRDPFNDLTLVFDLPNAKSPDLSFLNAYLPQGMVVIDASSGRIRAHVEGYPERQAAKGDIEVVAQGTVTPVKDVAITGNLQVHTEIRYGFGHDGIRDGGLIVLSEGPLEFPKASVMLTSATVQLRKRTIARNLTLEAESTFDRFALDAQETPEVLRFISGSMSVTGEVSDLRYLNDYIPQRADFRIRSGTGQIVGHFKTAHGQATATGDIALVTKDITTNFRDLTIGGNLEVQTDVRYGSADNGQRDGGLVIFTEGPFEIRKAAVALSSGEVLLRDGRAAQNLTVSVDSTFDRFVLDEYGGLGVLPFISGSIRIAGRVPGLGFLKPYFRKAPWLELSGSGLVQADLRLHNGKLIPGSRLSVDSEEIRATYLDFKALGSGKVRGRVARERGRTVAEVAVVLNDFEVGRLEYQEPHIFGSGFRITGTSSELDLTDPFTDLKVVLDIPESDVPSFAFYNAYIPSGSCLFIHSGRGRIRSHLEASARELSAKGEVELHAERVITQFGNVTMAGDLALHARLTHGDLKTRTFDITGTRVELNNMYVGSAKIGTDNTWWARVALPRGKGQATTPAQLEVQVDMELRDSRPLVVLLSEKKPIVRWFKNLLTVNNVKAHADVSIDGRAVQVSDLEMTGEKMEILGELGVFHRQLAGIFYAKLRALAVGVELRNGKKKWRLSNSRPWFDQHRPLYRTRDWFVEQSEPLTQAAPAAAKDEHEGSGSTECWQ